MVYPIGISPKLFNDSMRVLANWILATANILCNVHKRFNKHMTSGINHVFLLFKLIIMSRSNVKFRFVQICPDLSSFMIRSRCFKRNGTQNRHFLKWSTMR